MRVYTGSCLAQTDTWPQWGPPREQTLVVGKECFLPRGRRHVAQILDAEHSAAEELGLRQHRVARYDAHSKLPMGEDFPEHGEVEQQPVL